MQNPPIIFESMDFETQKHKKLIEKILKESIKRELERRKLKAYKIILFGSRTRGTYRKSSDWDLLIVLKNSLSRLEKLRTEAEIRSKLIQHGIRPDVIITTAESLRKFKADKGSIIYYALKEGKKL